MPDAPQPKRKTLQVAGERQESQLCRWEGIRRGLEGRAGFESTTSGLKVTRSAAERRTTAADSNSAVLTAWTNRFLVESGA